MPSVDVLGRLDGDAIGPNVAIIIGHVNGSALARLTLPDELAIRDLGRSPSGWAPGLTVKGKLWWGRESYSHGYESDIYCLISDI